MRETVQLTRGRPSTTLESTATSLEALHMLDIALNATSLEREGFLASVALRAGTIQPTAFRSEGLLPLNWARGLMQASRRVDHSFDSIFPGGHP